MTEELVLLLRPLNGGAPLKVPCTLSSNDAIVVHAIDQDSPVSQAIMLLKNPAGGSPFEVLVTIHDDGTVEPVAASGSYGTSGVLLFERASHGEPLQRSVAIAANGTITISNTTFTGSGAPTYDSAEIGLVDASTIEVRFSEKVASSDFTAGVTIKKNTVVQNIVSAARQANHTSVRYVLDAPADANDVVTWEYAKVAGDIADETDGTVLENVAAKTVTNNVSGVPPEFDTAEIGAVADTTVVVTLTENVSAVGNDYTTGVTVKVNNVAAIIGSGTRQANHKVIRYVIPAVDADDVVTWEYDAGTGIVLNEADGEPLADVAAQAVTNTVVGVPPTFVSAEVGTVNPTTVVAVFSVDLKAAGNNFSTGVTIEVNAAPVAISAGVRQPSHDTIHYTIPAVVNGDTVTIAYDDAAGLIQNEADSEPLATFSAQAVTNNVAP